MPAQSVLNEPDPLLLACVMDIWREVFARTGGDLAADSNFFLSGGDSLQLMRVLVRVRERLGVDLSMQEAARFSTPRKMAACCGTFLPAVPNKSLSVPPGRLQEQGAACFPCTAGQASLWLAEQCSETTGLYNTAILVHLAGALQVPVLARAVKALLDWHEILRATLYFDRRDRRLYAAIGATASPSLEPVVLDADKVRAHLVSHAARPLDLAEGPLWRFQLVTCGPGTWSLLICLHHCITDGWSGGVLLRHLAEAYNALLLDEHWQASGQDLEFRRFCMQQRKLTQDELRWWRRRLDGADSLATWPRPSPESGVQRWPFAMSCQELILDGQFLAPVHALRRVAQVQFSACLLAALRLAICALTGIDELCIGMPVSLRNTSAQENAVGYFVNLLVLRDRVDFGLGRVALLQQVQRNLSEALGHRTAALAELALNLKPRLLPSGNPWFDLVFAYQNLPSEAPSFTGLESRVEALTLAGQHPLKVEFVPTGDSCLCRVVYAHEVISLDEVRSLLDAIRVQLALLCGPVRNS